jgi:hypothetical protein
MKKITTLFFICLFLHSAFGQDNPGSSEKITLKWAPTGLILGNLSFQGEYGFGKKSSLTAKIGIPVNRMYEATYDDNNADISMKALSFLAGYRIYLSKQPLKGFYIEPFFKYVHHTSEGTGVGMLDNEEVTMNFTNDYNAAGIGAQLGTQFRIGKRVVIDLFFFGPELNSAKNNFKAVDISNSSAWNAIQSNEAEQDIREFLDEFPFIRKKVDVMVDANNRTVRANFKGALPGVRTGVSIGIAL